MEKAKEIESDDAKPRFKDAIARGLPIRHGEQMENPMEKEFEWFLTARFEDQLAGSGKITAKNEQDAYHLVLEKLDSDQRDAVLEGKRQIYVYESG